MGRTPTSLTEVMDIGRGEELVPLVHYKGISIDVVLLYTDWVCRMGRKASRNRNLVFI